VQDGLAKTSATPTQSEKDLQVNEVDCSSRLWTWLEKFIQRGWSAIALSLVKLIGDT
jgi:hypothetical protein